MLPWRWKQWEDWISNSATCTLSVSGRWSWRQHLMLEIVFKSVPKLLPDCTHPAQRHFFQCSLMAQLRLSSIWQKLAVYAGSLKLVLLCSAEEESKNFSRQKMEMQINSSLCWGWNLRAFCRCCQYDWGHHKHQLIRKTLIWGRLWKRMQPSGLVMS